MNSRWFGWLCLLLFIPVYAQNGQATADWQAGFAKAVITPAKPAWLSGYASRTKPSEGVVQDIYAKAVALQDRRGNRLVIVTTDLIGIPRPLAEAVAEQARQRYKLQRDQLLFAASHTHTGPALAGALLGMNLDTLEQRASIAAYTDKLQTQVLTVIGQALASLQPAKLAYGVGTARFGVNRRVFTPEGVKGGVNPDGPVDHDVPVLRIESLEGKLRGVLFGYACHNTTLTGEFYQVSGDYAGFAQATLEQAHPGAQAMFVMGAGADINPNPRSNLALAQSHGGELATTVEQTLTQATPLARGNLKLAFDRIALPFGPMPTQAEWEVLAKDANGYKRKHAERWLARLNRDGKLLTEYDYAVQTVQFGNSLRLVALAGEVVVDYALRLKRELGSQGLWVVGYANDACSYIPSARVLKEGGYEAADSMWYYDLPTSYSPVIEDRIIGKVRQQLNR